MFVDNVDLGLRRCQNRKRTGEPAWGGGCDRIVHSSDVKSLNLNQSWPNDPDATARGSDTSVTQISFTTKQKRLKS